MGYLRSEYRRRKLRVMSSTNEVLRLRIIREAQGRSLREVANAAGIDPTALSRIERGLRAPTTTTLVGIYQALGLTKALDALGLLPERR
jgi:transcriptional regulator with XRE-family HTH domain